MKILLGLVVILLLAGGGLLLAIRSNGPAVLDGIDRVTGGSRGIGEMIAAGFLSQGDNRRHLQRTRHGDHVELGTLFAQGILRAFQKGVGQIVIKSRLDDEDADGFTQDWSSPSIPRQPTMRRP